jgi:hypothetical protein
MSHPKVPPSVCWPIRRIGQYPQLPEAIVRAALTGILKSGKWGETR